MKIRGGNRQCRKGLSEELKNRGFNPGTKWPYIIQYSMISREKLNYVAKHVGYYTYTPSFLVTFV